MILADLRDHLLSHVDLTDKIGDRVHVNRAPTKTETPYLIVSRVSGDPQYTLAGEAGVAQTIIQISAWAEDPNGPSKADEVASLVRDKLSGYRGDWGDLAVSGCTLTGEPTEIGDPPDDASDNWFHGISQDYHVTHGQPVPTLS